MLLPLKQSVYPCSAGRKTFVDEAGKTLAGFCSWMPFTWLQFLLLFLFLTSSNFIVIAASCSNSRFFCFVFCLVFFFCFSSECRGENSVPFSARGSIYSSLRRQFEYRFFFLLSKWWFTSRSFFIVGLSTARSLAKVNLSSDFGVNSKRLD